MPERQRMNRWLADVTAHSDALDLEPEVFEKETAGAIAASLKRSAEASDRRKTSAFRLAMSMLTFYINRRAKPACRAEAHARGGERQIARIVRTQPPRIVRRVEARSVRTGRRSRSRTKSIMIGQRDACPRLSAQPALRPRSRRPAALEDFKRSVANRPTSRASVTPIAEPLKSPMKK